MSEGLVTLKNVSILGEILVEIAKNGNILVEILHFFWNLRFDQCL